MEKLKRTLKGIARTVLPWSLRRLIYRRLAFRYISGLPPIDPAKKTIVALNHFFDQDIRALALANTEYNLVAINAPRFFIGAKIFFNHAVRELLAPYETAEPHRRAQYRQECELLYRRLADRVNPALFVSTSDIFYWLREFVVVAREHGVNNVVVDKEGTISPFNFDNQSVRIRDFAPFISKHIFLWSERQREFWRRIGVADDDMTVIGQPRSDLLHREHRRAVDDYFPHPQPLITLFSYMANAYIPSDVARKDKLTWRVMRDATHAEFHRLAVQNRNYNFVIKTHPQQPDLLDLRRKYRRDNLRVIGGSAVANELLQRSELIIGFQTTAVTEAMMLGKNVIYTYWDPLIVRFKNDLLPFHEASGIVVAKSAEQFRAVCERFFKGDLRDFEFTAEQIAKRDEFVNGYFSQPDGHVCERFYDAVRRFVR